MKKFLSALLILALVGTLAGCQGSPSTSSDPSSSPSHTESGSSETVDASTAESSVTSIDDTVTSVPVSSETPATPSSSSTDEVISTPSLTPREQMNGEWRFVLPENKHTSDVYAFMGNRLVYDITITSDNAVLLLEKHYRRTDFDTVGAVEYFENKRYTLISTSQDIKPESFKGELSVSTDNANTFILNISGYETALGEKLIKEKHYFTLASDGKLTWSKAELLSEDFQKQYFPFDTETVFTKK